MRKMPGHIAKEILHSCDYQLHNVQNDQVIIVAGSNDITQGYYANNLDINNIVADVIGIGAKSRDSGANRVVIAAIPPRRHKGIDEVINQVNLVLKDQCARNEYLFLEHEIRARHLWNDGLHLNDGGLCILKMHILRMFITFDEQRCDFKKNFEDAL